MTFLLDTHVFAVLSQPKPHRGVARALERARLTAAGRPPPFLDAQIAAVAAVHDATVVTGNAGHFEMFDGLRVENWMA